MATALQLDNPEYTIDQQNSLIEKLRWENGEMRRTFGSHPLLKEKDAEIERLTERCAAYKGQVEAGSHEIERLTDAIWEYGEHRKSCRIDSGKECDCGFFDVIKSLKT